MGKGCLGATSKHGPHLANQQLSFEFLFRWRERRDSDFWQIGELDQGVTGSFPESKSIRIILSIRKLSLVFSDVSQHQTKLEAVRSRGNYPQQPRNPTPFSWGIKRRSPNSLSYVSLVKQMLLDHGIGLSVELPP